MRCSHFLLKARLFVTFETYGSQLSAAMTEFPSGPSQTPTLKGIPTAEPHVNFCVENPRMPQCARTDGSDAGKPKQSGSIYSELSVPNSFLKKSWPNMTCRISDSGDGEFTSFSSHEFPAGNQRPSATHWRI